jgi:outer membrane protein assembly factor BamB
MRRRTLLGACGGWLATTLFADDFPHWRGRTRDDHVAEDSGFDGQVWPLKKPLWEARVGEGSTSPIVVAGQVHVLGWHGERDTLHCLDATNGKSLWTQSYAAPRYARHATGDEGLYSGPTATPTYDAATKKLYTLGSDGELICWKADSKGERAWSINLYDTFKMSQRPRQLRSGKRDYGYTAAPLVYGDWLLVEAGGEQGTVVALDKHSGKTLWGSERRGFAGHTGGLVPLTIDGLPCVAVLTLTELVVLQVAGEQRGKTLATFAWETEWANNILTPTLCGSDRLLISAWHTHHAIACVQFSRAGAKPVWQSDYASHTGSPIVHQERVYLAGEKLVCLSAEDGKLVWQGGDFKDGASLLLTKDERLIALGSNGALALIESASRSPTAYRELARTDGLFATDAWPHVVVAEGRLLAKDRAGQVKCFALQA